LERESDSIIVKTGLGVAEKERFVQRARGYYEKNKRIGERVRMLEEEFERE